MRVARRKFSKIFAIFRAILAQHLRALDAKRALFQCRTHFRLGELQRRFFEYVQRSLAGCTQILCARRAEVPEILQFFRAISAQSLRDLNAGRALVRMSTQS